METMKVVKVILLINKSNNHNIIINEERQIIDFENPKKEIDKKDENEQFSTFYAEKFSIESDDNSSNKSKQKLL